MAVNTTPLMRIIQVQTKEYIFEIVQMIPIRDDIVNSCMTEESLYNGFLVSSLVGNCWVELLPVQ